MTADPKHANDTNKNVPYKGYPKNFVVEAKIDGAWRPATVITSATKSGSTVYTVKDQTKTWEVGPDKVRQNLIDLGSVDSMQNADHSTLIHALALREHQNELLEKKKGKHQLVIHLSQVTPTPFRYSQHFARQNHGKTWEAFKGDRAKSGLPGTENALAFVGEQMFFGVNMLGAFSACDWGVPPRGDIKDEELASMRIKFKNLFSFGKSCFVLETEKMKSEVK
jgi:hypothetical protein